MRAAMRARAAAIAALSLCLGCEPEPAAWKPVTVTPAPQPPASIEDGRIAPATIDTAVSPWVDVSPESDLIDDIGGVGEDHRMRWTDVLQEDEWSATNRDHTIRIKASTEWRCEYVADSIDLIPLLEVE